MACRYIIPVSYTHLAGGRESGRGPDRLEGKTAGGERPFLGTGVGIAGNLKEGV